jgi:hypothetical protein
MGNRLSRSGSSFVQLNPADPVKGVKRNRENSCAIQFATLLLGQLKPGDDAAKVDSAKPIRTPRERGKEEKTER